MVFSDLRAVFSVPKTLESRAARRFRLRQRYCDAEPSCQGHVDLRDEGLAAHCDRYRPAIVPLPCLVHQRLSNPLAVRSLKIHHLSEATQCAQALQFDQGVALRGILNLPVAAVRPLRWVLHHAGSHHVQINMDRTAMQMLVGLDRRGVITVFPECAVASSAMVVFLRGARRNELNAFGK